METIADQLEALRARRHDEAQGKYSELLQRFDAPRPGDAEELDCAMRVLRIDMHQLEQDIHLIQRYRTYIQESNKPGNDPAKEVARKDAEGIRKGHQTLFLAVEKK